MWLTWKPRMIEYCWIQSMLHESSHQNRVWLGEVIDGEVLFYDLHWANGCVYLKQMFFLFVQQFSSKRVINFESWCFAVLPSLYEKMKCSNNLGEGSKSVVPELVALKFIILWKAPDVLEILSRLCTMHTQRHTWNPLMTLILIESVFLL